MKHIKLKKRSVLSVRFCHLLSATTSAQKPNCIAKWVMGFLLLPKFSQHTLLWTAFFTIQSLVSSVVIPELVSTRGLQTRLDCIKSCFWPDLFALKHKKRDHVHFSTKHNGLSTIAGCRYRFHRHRRRLISCTVFFVFSKLLMHARWRLHLVTFFDFYNDMSLKVVYGILQAISGTNWRQRF